MKRRRKRPHQVHFGDRGIYIFESRHSPDFSMDFVEWDFHQLFVVREGQGQLVTAGAGRLGKPPSARA